MATLAFGFVHEIENAYKLSTAVPFEIIHLIILFLHFGGADLTLIPGDVDIKTISDTLNYRYFSVDKSIYTWINSILIAINPYQSPFTSIDHKQISTKYTQSQNAPHPFSIAAQCKKEMIEKKTNQSIIISGQSGSGKVLQRNYTKYTFILFSDYICCPTSIDRDSDISKGIFAGISLNDKYQNMLNPTNSNKGIFHNSRIIWKCIDHLK